MDFNRAIENVTTNMRDVMLANWCLWPAVQFVNIGLVPVIYRVLVVNLVATFWNLYLSWKNNIELEKKMRIEQEAVAA